MNYSFKFKVLRINRVFGKISIYVVDKGYRQICFDSWGLQGNVYLEFFSFGFVLELFGNVFKIY